MTIGFYVLGAFTMVAPVCGPGGTKRRLTLGERLNPLWLAPDGSGRASLANMQILFFSVILLFLVTCILARTGELAALSTHVLMLLGIAGVGSVGGKIVQPSSFGDLDDKLNALRRASRVFASPPTRPRSRPRPR